MGGRTSMGCGGVFGGGLFALFGVGFIAILFFVMPRYPRYTEVMEQGEAVSGKVTHVAADDSITINDQHPDLITFEFANQTREITVAMRENVSVGQEITVRTLDGIAYPESIEPLRTPWWIYAIPGVFVVLGLGLLISSLFRVIFLGAMIARRG